MSLVLEVFDRTLGLTGIPVRDPKICRPGTPCLASTYTAWSSQRPQSKDRASRQLAECKVIALMSFGAPGTPSRSARPNLITTPRRCATPGRSGGCAKPICIGHRLDSFRGILESFARCGKYPSSHSPFSSPLKLLANYSQPLHVLTTARTSCTRRRGSVILFAKLCMCLLPESVICQWMMSISSRCGFPEFSPSSNLILSTFDMLHKGSFDGQMHSYESAELESRSCKVY